MCREGPLCGQSADILCDLRNRQPAPDICAETDLFVDNLQTNRVTAATANLLPPRLRMMLNAGAFTPRIGRLGTRPPPALEDYPVGDEEVESQV